MRLHNKRCNHCQERYEYCSPSLYYIGYGNEDYCKNCLEIIGHALNTISVKYEKRHRNIQEIDFFKNLISQQVLE